VSRSFTIHEAPQRSAEWFAARCGRLTASCASKMLATVKSGEAADRRDLRTRLVLERLTGQPHEDTFVTKDMERGTTLEPEARGAYEAHTGLIVSEVGFIAHTEVLAGGSPDGVIGDFDGLVELKAPRSATHLRYLREGKMPTEHAAQVRHLLWLTGAPFCDFVSFDPRFPAKLQLFVHRVKRNETEIVSYEIAARAFLTEVEREYQDVLSLQAVA
jgi:hypothetical protein